jgi:thioredoxin 1
MKIIKFGAVWCAACSLMDSVLEELQLRHPEVKIQKIDVDVSPDSAINYGVRGLPTIIVLDDAGKEFARLVGQKTVGQLEEAMKEVD